MYYPPMIELVSALSFVVFALLAFKEQKKAWVFLMAFVIIRSIQTVPSLALSMQSILVNLPVIILAVLGLLAWQKCKKISFSTQEQGWKKLLFVAVATLLSVVYLYYVPFHGKLPISALFSFAILLFIMLILTIGFTVVKDARAFIVMFAYMLGMIYYYVHQIYVQLFPKPIISGGTTWTPVDEGFTIEMFVYDVCYVAIIAMFILAGLYIFTKSPSKQSQAK